MEVVPRYQPELEVSEHQQQYGLNADVPQQWHDPKAQETDLGQFLSPLNQSQGSTGKKGWVPVVAIAVALTAAIVGAAIGAGLGASLSKCQNNLGQCERASPAQPSFSSTTIDPSSSAAINSSSPTTVSPAVFPTTAGGLILDYTVEPAARIASLITDCDMLVPNYQTPLYGEKFSVYCHQDFGSGKRRDVGNNEVVLADVMALIAYSMADCMLACSQYTRWSNNAGIDSTCRSVTWASNLTYSDHVTGNCWLKNSTVTYDAGMTPCDWCYSATKVS